jgi:hypothetical protein
MEGVGDECNELDEDDDEGGVVVELAELVDVVEPGVELLELDHVGLKW